MVPSSRSVDRPWLRRRLLQGASAIVVAALLESGAAQAQTAAILRGAGHVSNTAGVPAIVAPPQTQGPALNPAMMSASQRAILNQAHATQAVSLAQQAQDAARKAAAALNPSVPNGLGAGGLQPVANPLAAANDPTGLSTWQGASAPTQTTANGQTTVSITQTDPRAVLSWTTFNVGANTTLVYQAPTGATPQSSWVTLNRVVGQINPLTGLRDLGTAPAPSQILGRIKAPWEILVLNPNGVLFSGTAQVNTYSLVATSLDAGQALTTGSTPRPLTIAERNKNFLTYGLLGYAEQASANDQQSAFTFSAEAVSGTAYDPTPEGAITIQAGAQIRSGDTGFLLFTAPSVVNAGSLSSPQGEVALESGRQIFVSASNGTANSIDPNVRGFVVSAQNRADSAGNSVANLAGGLIEADDGYVSLGATPSGSATNAGVLASSTSISRNGYVKIDAGQVQLAPASVISITPDNTGGTIPQDPTSLANFKTSRVSIGDANSLIDIGKNSLIYAPSAEILVGALAGATTTLDGANGGDSKIFVDSGAVIDVAGLTNVEVSASTNSVEISPVTTNDIQDSPNEKALLGATVFIDPRLSGVRSDGVAWVGSPILSAAGFAQQVGVQVTQLMTRGGDVTLGVASANPANPAAAPSVVVKPGAVIDVSGGWVTYDAGWVRTSRLIDAAGEVVNIAEANPNTVYLGVYNGYTAIQQRWGVSQTFADPIQNGMQYEGAYTEGHDAGSLAVVGSVAALDGTVYANAYAGTQQILGAKTGTATSPVYGDQRALQGAWTQLPAGGYLAIQGYGAATGGGFTGAGDIELTPGATGSSTAGLSFADPLPTDRLDTILLSAPAISAMGLSQLSLSTSGRITLDAGATVTLNPGGDFTALSGRALTVNGTIAAPAGHISLTTAQLLPQGSILLPDSPQQGSYDVTVNGQLLVNGRWVNDEGAAPGALKGSAWLNGGSISISAAPNVTLFADIASVSDTLSGAQPSANKDISGSILINSGALLDLSGGGYVSETGGLNLTSRGGDLTLTEATNYFQLSLPTGDQPVAGAISGVRITSLPQGVGVPASVAVNPDAVTARVALDGTIRADGFSGGGTFNLTTPAFGFASSPADRKASVGTLLPMDFFHATGFGAYNITSYKTALLANQFDNGLGGYNALLQTQVLTVGKGQTLDLTQTGFSPIVDAAQTTALRNLATGGDLYGVLTPGTASDAWDQLPVKLALGGLIELKVEAGGQVIGAPGAALTVGLLDNQGTIRLPGGTLTQSEVLPALYADSNVLGVTSLAQVLNLNSQGAFDENAANAAGIIDPATRRPYTNAGLVAADSFYLLGDLAPGVGVELEPGSVTDLSGTAVVNPRAAALGAGVFTPIVNGKVLPGGVFQSLSELNTGASLIPNTPGQSVYSQLNVVGVRLGDVVQGQDATLNVSGASAVFDQQGLAGTYTPTPVWSNGGALTFGGGALLQGMNLNAAGGAPSALGGTLILPNLVLTQTAPASAQMNELAAGDIEAAGIATLVDQGRLSSAGSVDLKLARGFFLTSANYAGAIDGQDPLATSAGRDQLAPIVSATGDLTISAPYIGLDSAFQTVSTPVSGTAANHTVTFQATAIDVVGAVRFDQSVGVLNLEAQQDLRLIGVQPWQLTFNSAAANFTNSLVGQLAVNGDLNVTAAQVYPTTGSSFSITSVAPSGTITFAQTQGSNPTAPYSAGGSLLVQAANIVQGGILRAPLGQLTLGSNTPFSIGSGSSSVEFAPATQSVTLAAGGTTSVSAAGLSIPYGTTTDQTEWFFAPTDANPLTAPPAGVLSLAGQAVSIRSGAKVDLSGGGDAYAYEFVPGTGGSHDLLSQFNTDAYSANLIKGVGYQYPDQRQVYAIVPGLSSAVVAPYDPIYSANYGGLYGPSQVGMSVYLNAAPGLAAGWYTLLPAQYALLPGGMRVVQDTGATGMPPVGGNVLADGTMVVSGRYGVAGADASSSSLVTFDVQSQSTFRKYSDIALTSADQKFAATAASAGVSAPRLPVDAGRLVLDPVSSLDILAPVITTPGASGRGGEADISGAVLDIVSAAPAAPTAGVIALTADELTQLNAASLLIGGVRSQNADGTTSLSVSAHSITVENDDSHPLAAPEVVLAVDGGASQIRFKVGSDITAKGTADPNETGGYLITGGANGETGQGALVRVANGPDLKVQRAGVIQHIGTGRLIIGSGVILNGLSTLLDATGDMRIEPTLKLTTTDLRVDSPAIDFSSNTSLSGLVITPALQARFAAAKQLNLQSTGSIGFAAGGYAFNALSLDAVGFNALDSGQVSLSASQLTLANSTGATTTCASAASCGTANLQVSATTIGFGSGAVSATGFGGGVTLAAQTGVYADGAGGLDAGTANLAIRSPFIGDQATPSTVGSTTSAKASLTFATLGDVAISNPSGATAAAPDGTPGASLTVNGAAISVSGSTLRATAGQLDLVSATGISISGGAVLETPGYSKTFGDAADPYAITAPGGVLSLTAKGGDISLASGTKLSVGGGTGAAGTLSLAATGAIDLGATIDGSAPNGGASIAVDTGSSFDLSSFQSHWGAAFTGAWSIRAGSGDLSLAQGLSLKATGVDLTADAGRVDIAGAIDVSGVNGGQVGLYGGVGVTLESGAQILAQAKGYGADDTRQATGGQVSLGVSGTGAIQVDSGALIDISALHTGARLVALAAGGGSAFAYVPGDTGGSVLLRAPVVTGNGGETVNVTFSGQIKGASSIVLEGYEAVDLGAVAASGAYTGVTVANGQATLDLSQAGTSAKPNFLADNAPGTLVSFIQGFDISQVNGQLGGLASQPGFSERPGVELDYSGNITLASNWNLGAGAVDVAGAVKAGLMAADPSLPGEYYVLPGDEGAVFANYTSLTYRTGGKVTGQPGALSIRAGGQLDIQGSITDGFFTFADQTDPGYVSLALGGGAPGAGTGGNQAYLTPTCSAGACTGVQAFNANGAAPGNVVSIQFPNSGGLASNFSNPAPYSAAANAPDALGALATPTSSTGGGDPIGSAELFPLVAGAPVQSWSYRLVGGAAASANPMRAIAGGSGDVVVEGLHPYQLSATTTPSQFLGALDLQAGSTVLDPTAWLGAFEAANGFSDGSAYTVLDFSGAPSAARQALSADLAAFYAANLTTGANGPNMTLAGSASRPTGLNSSLSEAEAFIAFVNSPSAPVDFAKIGSAYRLQTPVTAFRGAKTIDAPTLIRTGTGSISIAAAGTIDLRNGATPTYQNDSGSTVSQALGGVQLGGVAVYTAGHVVGPGQTAVSDTLSGGQYLLDTTASGSAANVFASPPAGGYRYGAGASPTDAGVGFTDILLANPVYAEGGGDVTLKAGVDVLGRRDLLQNERLNNDYNQAQNAGYSWIGHGDQPWRTGQVGAVTDIRIDPQLFQEGVATLGGGSVSISAGRNVSDLSVVADTTVATAAISKASDGAPAGQALVSYGGGDVAISAGADLLGGRVDVGSGSASLQAAGNIASAGAFTAQKGVLSLNDLVLRLTDATVSLSAGGSVEMQGVAALGVRGGSEDNQANFNAMGFYSAKAGISIVADGAVTVDNAGLPTNNAGSVLLTPANTGTGGVYNAIYPGSLQAVSLTGDLNLQTAGATVPDAVQSASAIIMTPSPTGSLNLAAAGNVASVETFQSQATTTRSVVYMEDASPNVLPGAFSSFTMDANGNVLSGLGFAVTPVLSDTPQTTLAEMHASTPTHAGDSAPNRIYAGTDILEFELNSPKQARIGAGRDVVDMAFFGQNLSGGDITRITAGRDITATTALVRPVIGLPNVLGGELPAVQGDTFVIGGPGAFFLEAGRNAGPFLNSAVTNGFAASSGANSGPGLLTYGGGVLAVGNEWNPWLAQQSADIYTEFGVGKGENFAGLIEAYLDPANLASMPAYLFDQTTDAAAVSSPDRSKPIYGPILISWMQAHADSLLTGRYGTDQVTYQQAFDAFQTLTPLEQRQFLLKSIYFNELQQTSIPTSVSYKDYARGYTAVNTLFPASYGYTANDLSGGANGAQTTVSTGDLDLRLATIQTDQGGSVVILGPGGRVLAGSTVSTAVQAERRAYVGGRVFDGGAADGPLASAIQSIPVGDEGILTLQGGGIYTFTDKSFLLNQSRLFTEAGGDILMWSSNADLNAGEGPKTSADFPPIAVTVDQNLFSQINKDANVTGAGIAAFEPAVGVAAPNVYLIAPRGTVDAGAAGVRVAGNLFIAANSVANADNFKVSGTSFGIPQTGAVNIGAQSTAGSAAAAAAANAQAVAGGQGAQTPRSQISVNISGPTDCPADDPRCRR